MHDINKDELEVSVFDKDLFSPNGELAHTDITYNGYPSIPPPLQISSVLPSCH